MPPRFNRGDSGVAVKLRFEGQRKVDLAGPRSRPRHRESGRVQLARHALRRGRHAPRHAQVKVSARVHQVPPRDGVPAPPLPSGGPVLLAHARALRWEGRIARWYGRWRGWDRALQVARDGGRVPPALALLVGLGLGLGLVGEFDGLPTRVLLLLGAVEPEGVEELGLVRGADPDRAAPAVVVGDGWWVASEW